MFLLGFFFASSGIAAAVDPEELIRQGVDLRRKGDDVTALQRFEQAFQIAGSRKAMAQIGLAEQALGRWAAAHEHLNRALEDVNDPWIKKNRKLIADALKRVNEHVGQLEILGGSPGAVVRLDGSVRGKLPLARPIVMATGAVTIDLVAPGFVSRQRTTTVRAGETVRESFDALEPSAPPASTAATAAAVKVDTPPGAGIPTADTGKPGAAAAASASGPTNSSEPVPAITPADSDANTGDQAAAGTGSLRSKAKWVAWGVGAVSLGVGIFGGVRQNSAGNDFSHGCAVYGSDVVLQPGSTRTIGECRTLKDKLDTNFTVEVVGLIGAGVFAAAGVVLWLTEPSTGEAQTSSLFCSPAMTAGHGPSVGCTYRF